MASNEKKPSGFFLYPTHVRSVCTVLSLADAGRLLLALCNYAETGELPSTPRKTFQAAFSLLRADVDRDAERYREICERNRERVNRRWHGDPPSDSATVYRGIPPYTYTTQPNATQPNATQPNTAHPNTTQPNTTQPAAAAAASGPCPMPKGVTHDRSGNSRKIPGPRGTVL